jgi:diguanylate cyclase (GGDEF)-like protein
MPRYSIISVKLLLILLAHFVVQAASASADNIRFESISLKGQLSQQTIMSIYQDKKGYMWFGTQEGLNKYDGTKFTSYLPKRNDPHSISSSWIYSIAEDDDGRIWVATTNGVNVLDANTNKFTRYTATSHPNTLNGNDATLVFKDGNGTMWVATEKGLNRYRASDGTFTQHNYFSENSNDEIGITAIVEDITGALWLGSNQKGLMRFDPETAKYTSIVTHLSKKGDKKRFGIGDLFLDKNQVLWIASGQNGLYTLDFKKPKSTSFEASITKVTSFTNDDPTVIAKDNNGMLWVGSSRGLYYKKPDSEVFSHLNAMSLASQQLSEGDIWSLYSDAAGVFWVGAFNGLNQWNTRTTQFDHYYEGDVLGRALSSNNSSVISSDGKNKIYIGSTGGVDILNLESEVVSALPIAGDNIDGLQEPSVMSLAYVSDEEIWFGYRSSGASRYNAINNTFTHYSALRSDPTSIGGNGISGIVYTQQDELWFSSFGGGLSKYERETDSFVTFTHDPFDPSSLSSNDILTIYESRNGNLWVGTWSDGLNIFVPKSETAFRIMSDPNAAASISDGLLLSIFEDSENNIWVGTHSGGINILSAENRDKGLIEFTQIDSEHGMPSNVVYGFLEDEEGYIWASTNKGLVKINRNTRDILIYDAAQGIQGSEFNSGAYYKDTHGYMYFGGINGLTRFNPKNITPNKIPPNIEFTSFQRLNQFLDIPTALNENGVIEVYYKDYLVGFDFAALDFAAPLENKYKYKLEGFDTHWIDARDIGRATYTNLPSGTFEFKVIASNSDDVWNNEGKSITLLVNPPPWFSWWAYTIYFVLFAFVARYSFSRYKEKIDSQTKYQIKLEKEVNIRTAELSEVNEKLLAASVTDQLSGLYNRRYLADMISARIEDIDTSFGQAILDDDMHFEKGPRLMALMFDLDGFKPINDNYGHDAGDKIIVQVARILESQCRKEDIVIRWGGDEFMLVAKVNDLQDASKFAESIRVAIANNTFDIGLSKKFHLSTSLGFALYPFCHYMPRSLSWDEIHLLADQALYQSKNAGRNTWTGIAQVEQEIPFPVLNSLVPNLEKAIEENNIRVIRPGENIRPS